MLADPARIRLMVVGGAILVAAAILRLATGNDAEPTTPPPASVTVSDEQAAERNDRDTAPDLGDEAGDEEEALEQAHAAAAAFAEEYLTWAGDESTADRAARIGDHASASFATQLADARTSGAADADTDAQVDQTVEVLGTQTTTSRSRHIEVTVMTEVTVIEDDEDRTVPTNLSVALRQEDGRWVVDDLR